MEIDEDKIDDAVLALLWLTLGYHRLKSVKRVTALRLYGSLQHNPWKCWPCGRSGSNRTTTVWPFQIRSPARRFALPATPRFYI